MRRIGYSLPVILVFGGACSRLPESFPPPPQRAALAVLPAGSLGYGFSMEDATAGDYLVQDFQDRGTSPWRWTYAHPVLRFFVPEAPRLNFTMDFTIPPQTFRDTGPVTLTLRVNGALLDRHRCSQPGQQHYSHGVPNNLLRANAINFVAIDPDPVWVSSDDGTRLGFILSRAGFTE